MENVKEIIFIEKQIEYLNKAYQLAPNELDASDATENSLESMLKHQGKYVPDFVDVYSWMTDLDLILSVVLYQDEVLDCRVQSI